ncbi:MAG TPA: phage holin family protein [Burkholderiaceae bacterium]|jgi:uncharacterized membrane protein YqjE|nr:phage holin family protein [Burkholderiaceae bacterium]
MGVADSLARLAATFIAIVRTRAELAAVEIEEEALRYFSYLLLALAAMFFFGLAILLVILLVVAVYWDTHRIGVLSSLIALFAVAGIWLGLKVRNSYRYKPGLLGQTLVELSKDIETLKPS